MTEPSASPTDDIQALDRVLTRLALLDAGKLNAVARNLMVPILKRIDPGKPEVMNKAVEVLSHIRRRVSADPTNVIPFSDVLSLFWEGSKSQAVFAQMMLDLGWPHASLAELQPLPSLLLRFLCDSSNAGDVHSYNRTAWVSRKFLECAQRLSAQEESEGKPRFQEVLGAIATLSGAARKRLLPLLRALLIAPYNLQPFMQENTIKAPPGMCRAFLVALCGVTRPTEDSLLKHWPAAPTLLAWKRMAFRMISSDLFLPVEILEVALHGLNDPHSEITQKAQELVKWSSEKADIHSAAVAQVLYGRVLGSTFGDEKVLPCPSTVKSRCLSLLQHSSAGLQASEAPRAVILSLFAIGDGAIDVQLEGARLGLRIARDKGNPHLNAHGITLLKGFFQKVMRTEPASGGNSVVRIAAEEARKRALEKAERDRQRIAEGITRYQRAAVEGAGAEEGDSRAGGGGGGGSDSQEGKDEGAGDSQRIRIRDLSTYDRLREALYSGLGSILSAMVREAEGRGSDAFTAITPHARDVATLLFARLSEEGDGNTKIAIAEALSFLRSGVEVLSAKTPEFASEHQDAVHGLLGDIEGLLEKAIKSDDPIARSVSVDWSISLFPAHHAASKVNLCRACGDPRREVRERATAALLAACNSYGSGDTAPAATPTTPTTPTTSSSAAAAVAMLTPGRLVDALLVHEGGQEKEGGTGEAEGSSSTGDGSQVVWETSAHIHDVLQERVAPPLPFTVADMGTRERAALLRLCMRCLYAAAQPAPASSAGPYLTNAGEITAMLQHLEACSEARASRTYSLNPQSRADFFSVSGLRRLKLLFTLALSAVRTPRDEQFSSALIESGLLLLSFLCTVSPEVCGTALSAHPQLFLRFFTDDVSEIRESSSIILGVISTYLPLGDVKDLRQGKGYTWYSLLRQVLQEGIPLSSEALSAESWRFPAKAALPSSLEHFVGSLDACTRMIARRVSGAFPNGVPRYDATVWSTAGVQLPLLAVTVNMGLTGLSHKREEVVATASAGLARLLRTSCFPIADGFELDAAIDAGSVSAQPGVEVTKLSLAVFLAEVLHSTSTKSLHKRGAAQVLGALAGCEVEYEFRSWCVRELLRASRLKDPGVALSIGDALVESLLGGRNSLSLAAGGSTVLRTLQEDAAAGGQGQGQRFVELEEDDKQLMDGILAYLMHHAAPSLVPQERFAAAAWGMAVLVGAGASHLSPFRMKSLQGMFLWLLRDREVLTQEAAGKALAALYTASSGTAQTELLEALTSSFQSGRRAGSTAAFATRPRAGEEGKNEETEVENSEAWWIEHGHSGEGAPQADSKAYREMISLANEAGQPELIYQLLAISGHNTMWQTRGASSLALSTLLTGAAREQVQQHMHKLVPQLYRYTFDPDPKVRDSMTQLWDKLTLGTGHEAGGAHTRDILKARGEEILKYLIKGMQTSKWREREAALRGLGFGMQTLAAGEYFSRYLSELWLACSTLMDDVKESVREAAGMVIEDLSKISIHLCDTSEVTKRAAGAVLNAILPFLLGDKGIGNAFPAARARALKTLLQLLKVAVGSLFHWAPRLLSAFLSHMSDLERPELATLQMHTDAGTGMYGTQGMSGEDLARARLEAAAGRGSPWMESIRRCLEELSMPLFEEEASEDERAKGIQEQYRQLSDALTEAMTSLGVGLPTRGGAARIAGLVARECPGAYVKPIVPALLKGLRVLLHDDAFVVRREACRAGAEVCAVASAAQNWRWMHAGLQLTGVVPGVGVDEATAAEATADTLRTVAVMTMEYVKQSKEQREHVLPKLIPSTFLFCHWPATGVRSIWREAWEQCIEASNGSLVHLYSKEIMFIVSAALKCSSWNLRHVGAIAAGSVMWLLAPSGHTTWALPLRGREYVSHMQPGNPADAAAFTGSTASDAWLNSVQQVKAERGGASEAKGSDGMEIERDESLDAAAWRPLRPFLGRVALHSGNEEEVPTWALTMDPLLYGVGAVPAFVPQKEGHKEGNEEGSREGDGEEGRKQLLNIASTSLVDQAFASIVPALQAAVKGHWRGRLDALLSAADAAQLLSTCPSAPSEYAASLLQALLKEAAQVRMGVRGRCSLLRAAALVCSQVSWMHAPLLLQGTSRLASVFTDIDEATSVALRLIGEQPLSSWQEQGSPSGSAEKRQRVATGTGHGVAAGQGVTSGSGEGRLHRSALWSMQGDTLIAALELYVASLPGPWCQGRTEECQALWQQRSFEGLRIALGIATQHTLWHVRLRAWKVVGSIAMRSYTWADEQRLVDGVCEAAVTTLKTERTYSGLVSACLATVKCIHHLSTSSAHSSDLRSAIAEVEKGMDPEVKALAKQLLVL